MNILLGLRYDAERRGTKFRKQIQILYKIIYCYKYVHAMDDKINLNKTVLLKAFSEFLGVMDLLCPGSRRVECAV